MGDRDRAAARFARPCLFRRERDMLAVEADAVFEDGDAGGLHFGSVAFVVNLLTRFPCGGGEKRFDAFRRGLGGMRSCASAAAGWNLGRLELQDDAGKRNAGKRLQTTKPMKYSALLHKENNGNHQAYAY